MIGSSGTMDTMSSGSGSVFGTSGELPTPCPCGSAATYAVCCGPVHRGHPAATAEQMMRSRYAAFARGDVAYLRRTWHPSTRPTTLELDPLRTWVALEILRSVEDGDCGVVEFRAHYRIGAGPRTGEQHEVSRFVREQGRWRYLGAEA